MVTVTWGGRSPLSGWGMENIVVGQVTNLGKRHRKRSITTCISVKIINMVRFKRLNLYGKINV